MEKVTIINKVENKKLICELIINDSSLLWTKAKLLLSFEVNVNLGSSINYKKELYIKTFTITELNKKIVIDFDFPKNYSYE